MGGVYAINHVRTVCMYVRTYMFPPPPLPPSEDGRVCYKGFCDMMENSYNVPNLEQNPTMQVHWPLRGQLSRVRMYVHSWTQAHTHTWHCNTYIRTYLHPCTVTHTHALTYTYTEPYNYTVAPHGAFQNFI